MKTLYPGLRCKIGVTLGSYDLINFIIRLYKIYYLYNLGDNPGYIRALKTLHPNFENVLSEFKYVLNVI